MPRFLKIFVLAALLLAVPMRSFAASGMLLCGPLSDHQPPAVESVQGHGNDHAAGHAHSENLAEPSEDGDGAPGSSTCSACGASCSAAMASPVAVIAPCLIQTSSLIAFFGLPFSGFTPESADRPPLL